MITIMITIKLTIMNTIDYNHHHRPTHTHIMISQHHAVSCVQLQLRPFPPVQPKGSTKIVIR